MDLTRRDFLAVSGAAAVSAAHPPTAAAADDPLQVRGDFPAASESLYLNSAYITPVPRAVAEAGRAFADRKATRPIPLDDMLAKTTDVRAQFARLINAEPAEVGFLYATSEGENILARAVDLEPGDNVVVDELHYNTTFVPIERHTVELAMQLRDGLARLGFRMFTPAGNRSSIVSFYLGRNQADARTKLDAAGAQVSFREKGSQIRVSPALFNTRDDIRRFLDVAKTFA
jgi:selenocysteine lyase/cysteine desulfurase